MMNDEKRLLGMVVRENRLFGLVVNPRHPFVSAVNYILMKVSQRLNLARSWGYPYHVTLEPTSVCNLRCPLCPTGDGTLGRAKGRMSIEHFKRIIDEIGPYLGRLELAGLGEPTINPDLSRMIRYAADGGVWVHLDTNVTLIDTPEKVRDLIASGLGTLNMSIDGATQETYAAYRVNGDLAKVIENLKALVAEKQRQGVLFPEIVCQVVVTRINEHEIDRIREMALGLGVDRFVAKSATLAMVRPGDKGDIPTNLVERFLPRTRQFRRYQRKDAGIQNGCGLLYRSAFVQWNGDLTTCCHDPRGVNTRGNILKQGSFKDVWNSPSYTGLRRQIAADIRKATPLCSECPVRLAVYTPAEESQAPAGEKPHAVPPDDLVHP
jgi:radical SAM protein with 4Fe4S-binding SPASM domain